MADSGQMEKIKSSATAELHDGGSQTQGHVIEMMTRVQSLRRQHVLLVSQLARAAKCLNSVATENRLLKSEIQGLESLAQNGGSR